MRLPVMRAAVRVSPVLGQPTVTDHPDTLSSPTLSSPFYFTGWASEEELMAHIAKLQAAKE